MAKKQFKSESKRLLDLMINSIYTHKEIFLREIISNASDAIDKLCFLSLTDQNVGLNREDFKIELSADKDNRILKIKDNGIGMSKEDLENNLGVIASSGSYRFKQENKQPDDIDIIGQFGVGFYSAFMVADKIEVLTKKYGEETGSLWQSSGADGYTIKDAEKETVGTEITLYIKEDTEEENYSEFLDEYKIRSLVKKYSDYIRYPIEMEVSTSKLKEGTEENPEYETVYQIETLNSMVPIWQRAKKDVTQEEYEKFYQEKFMAFDKPAKVISTSVEGVVTYKALLYVPSKTPFDFYTKEYKKGLQLYSSGVLIMDNCQELLPDHFRFVKGVVDSQDFSLNISREVLQHNHQLKTVAQTLEKKIKNELLSMLRKDREQYENFFNEFGRQLKYGVVNDYGMHKETLKDLLLFYSSKEEKLITLDEYIDKMTEDQKYIFFATGENAVAISKLPQTELVKSKGYEILYCTQDIDEFTLKTLMSYKDKEFRSVDSDDLGIENTDNEENTNEFNETLTFVKETLGDKVSKVIASKKLISHPVCMTAQGSISFEMEKYFKEVQPEANMKAERCLELNINHDAVKALKDAIANDKEKAKKYAEILYNQSLLIAGLPIDDPSAYGDLVCSLF